MRPKTKELLDLVKRSRGLNKVGIEHIRELVADVSASPEMFLSDASAFLNSTGRTVSRPKRTSDPVSLSIEGFQARAGLDRKAFLGFVVQRLAEENKALKTLPKRQQTLPKVIEFYGALVGTQKLEAVAEWVAKKYSQAH